jgi:hypothetical protein
MKAYRISIVVLSILVVVLGILALTGRTKPTAAEPNVVERWQTNTVDRWQTNVVELWRTNTVEVARNSVLRETVTNEVIKPVPAKLSASERQAATLGYMYINAPSIDDQTYALYQASPVTLEVTVDRSASNVFTAGPETIKKKLENDLSSQGIPLAQKSPYKLNLKMDAVWVASLPSVALVTSSLELKDNVVVKRQEAVLQYPGTLWNASTSRLVRTGGLQGELDACLRDVADKFCRDYLKAKENAKEVESRLPKLPSDFLAEAQ